ncbi:DUF5666 domain-containing protein [Poseidonocella sp. HB161398]|uniref:DUF5666 domain-containing protein n=1 Tax=Poseidonocella sp. HB161398 TaxID=2320855 RepID=UPI00110A08C3|nr:DUF5666 domain-containing protein [Poseidonocella sp. HB161398]
MTAGPLARLALCLALLAAALPAAAQEPAEPEGGIVGTGISGTITALGSIIVNGQRIAIDPDQPVRDGLGPEAAGALRPGDTVAVVAEAEADGSWRARSIRRVLPLVGPVAGLGGGAFRVLGTTVEAGPLAEGLSEGDWVAVSGLWREGGVAASRIEPVPPELRIARVMGSAFPVEGGSDLMVGGTRVTGIATSHLRPGDVILATGAPSPGGLSARTIATGLFDQPVGAVLAEGYLSTARAGGLYTLLGSGLVAWTENPGMIDPGGRILRCGIDGALEPQDQAPGGPFPCR